MKYYFKDNELVIKKLFSEKSYSFSEITRINFEKCFEIFCDEKSILKEKSFNQKAILHIDLLHLAAKNGWIIEDLEWFDNEISVKDLQKYSLEIQENLKQELSPWVKEKLGDEYSFVIDVDESAYHVRLFLNIYRNGEKVFINDKEQADIYSDWLNGKKDIHLTWFELAMPHYINPKTQEFKITKAVKFNYDIDEFKNQVLLMKEMGAIAVSELMIKNS